MSNEILEAEVVPAVDEKLVKYAGETGLEKPATETLVHAFAPVFAKARGALADAAGVAASVKDATCVTEIKKSRACRLAIRAVRLEGETVHKKQKEAALRFGRAVDGFRNILLADLQPVEQALQDAEDTAERAEAARKAALRQARVAELFPFLDSPVLIDLGELSETAYAKVLSDAKLLKQAKIDAAAKAEAERLAREEADRKERERVAAENARLKEEAIAREAAAKAEREAAERAARAAAEKAAKERAAIEAKAKAEREGAEKRLAAERAAAEATIKAAAEKARIEREAIEAKAREERALAKREADRREAELAALAKEKAAAKAKADAEAKAVALAARKAAAAPDRAKLLAYSTTLRSVPLPSFADETLNQEVLAEASRLIHWLTNKAQGLA